MTTVREAGFGRVCLFLTLAFVALTVLGACAHTVQPTMDSTVIYLLRHAEKMQTDGRDPTLSVAGHERANALARMLRHVHVDALFSSDYKRTRQTLAPLAQLKNRNVQIYAANDSAALVKRVLAKYQGQTLVIAGHSNTVPELVGLFLGMSTPQANLADDEYDRLYAIVLSARSKPQVLELAFPF